VDAEQQSGGAVVVRRYLRTFRWRYVLRPFVVGCVVGLVFSGLVFWLREPRPEQDVSPLIGALDGAEIPRMLLRLFVVTTVSGGIAGVVGRGVTGWLAVTLGLAIGTGAIIRSPELALLNTLGMVLFVGAFFVGPGYWLVRLFTSVSAGSRAASQEERVCPKCGMRVAAPARFCPFGHELPPPP